MKHYGDITKISGAEIEPVDIITFGSPCQDLSVAGGRKGLSGERSGLFMEWLAKKVADSLGDDDLTMGSLFSGIGGFELAFSKAGVKPVFASEVEEFCIAVTTKHFGEEDAWKKYGERWIDAEENKLYTEQDSDEV